MGFEKHWRNKVEIRSHLKEVNHKPTKVDGERNKKTKRTCPLVRGARSPYTLMVWETAFTAKYMNLKRRWDRTMKEECVSKAGNIERKSNAETYWDQLE